MHDPDKSVFEQGYAVGYLEGKKIVFEKEKILKKAQALVSRQAEIVDLWWPSGTKQEALLQLELRRLHAIIEDNDKDLAIIEGRIK